MNSFQNLREKLSRSWGPILNNRHFKFGFPFILLVVGSSFVVAKIRSSKYEILAPRNKLTKEEYDALVKAKQITAKDPNYLEKVYEEYAKNLKDDYEIIRGPRPWEPHPQEELRQKNRKLNHDIDMGKEIELFWRKK